jgi:hypothetical protein
MHVQADYVRCLMGVFFAAIRDASGKTACLDLFQVADVACTTGTHRIDAVAELPYHPIPGPYPNPYSGPQSPHACQFHRESEYVSAVNRCSLTRCRCY